MRNLTVTKGKAIQIIRDELARQGIRPLMVHIETALRTVRDGGLLLHTGAKLLFSSHSRRYHVGGYAYDGSDVRPFEDNRTVAERSAAADRLFD